MSCHGVLFSPGRQRNCGMWEKGSFFLTASPRTEMCSPATCSVSSQGTALERLPCSQGSHSSTGSCQTLPVPLNSPGLRCCRIPHLSFLSRCIPYLWGFQNPIFPPFDWLFLPPCLKVFMCDQLSGSPGLTLDPEFRDCANLLKELMENARKSSACLQLALQGHFVPLPQALCDMGPGIKEKRKKGKAFPYRLYFCLIREHFKLISPPFLLHKRKLCKK